MRAHPKTGIFILLTYNILWYLVHSVHQFVIVFQINFIGLLFGIFGSMLYFQKRMGTSATQVFLTRYMQAIFTAGGCWIVDSVLCHWVQVLPFNPQLHAWWHALCGLACHYSLMFEIMLRASLHKTPLHPTGGFLLSVAKMA